MRIHTSCLRIFASCLALLLMGLAINNALDANASGGSGSRCATRFSWPGYGEKRLLALDEQATWLSVSSKVNLFSLYDREKNMATSPSRANSSTGNCRCWRELPAVERIYAMFPGQQRQITNRLRYETLDAQLHASIVNAAGGVLVQDADLCRLSPVQRAPDQDGSLIAVGQSARGCWRKWPWGWTGRYRSA